MIKDRGNIKWTSLMLTEHRDKLKELKEMDEWVEKPELDEQEKERLDVILKEAICNQFTVELLYYENERVKAIKGKMFYRNNKLLLGNKQLVLDNIIDIKLL